MSSTWGVVATVRAPLYLCKAYARHYLNIGASAVYLYHDDPSMVSLVDMPGVFNRVCDEDYWRGDRPDGLEMRQRINATDAKRKGEVDWLMHCDVDELCHSQEPIADVLSSQQDDTAGLTVAALEAVYRSPPTPDTLYATPYFKAFVGLDGEVKAYTRLSAEIYGNIWHASRNGFWGHAQGKSFIRTSVDIGKMPLHHKGLRTDGWNMRVPAIGIALRHYDATSFDLWKEKHMRRIIGDVKVPNAGRFRAAQQALISSAWEDGGEKALFDLYCRFACLSDEQLERGLAAGFVRMIEPEPHLLSTQSV